MMNVDKVYDHLVKARQRSQDAIDYSDLGAIKKALDAIDKASSSLEKARTLVAKLRIDKE